jgi:5'-nucleotidase
MFRFLHTNDMHGTLTPEIASQLNSLRSDCDFYFDSGDCIKTGNLGIPLKPDSVWLELKGLGLTASVLGNRETHPLTSAAEMKTRGATHDVLVANMTSLSGEQVYAPYKIYKHNGIHIGVFGVMVPMATERMRTRAAWSYRWSSPIARAIEVTHELRPQCDVLIALTHIGNGEDHQLAKECPGIDVILGGHSHTVLQQPEKIRNTVICQGGSHNRFAGVYQWNRGVLNGELIVLKK